MLSIKMEVVNKNPNIFCIYLFFLQLSNVTTHPLFSFVMYNYLIDPKKKVKNVCIYKYKTLTICIVFWEFFSQEADKLGPHCFHGKFLRKLWLCKDQTGTDRY